MADGAGEEPAGSAGRIEQDFARPRVDPVRHEGGHGARRVILAGVAGALQVVEDLLVDVAEMLTVGEVVEVDLLNRVDDLPHQLAGLHVIVGVLEHAAHHRARTTFRAADVEVFQGRKQVRVDEVEQRVAGDAFGVGRPVPPAPALRDRRPIDLVEQLLFLILVVDDLEKKHPAKLRNALRVAVDARVLAHDVLNGFDDVPDRHAYPASL